MYYEVTSNSIGTSAEITAIMPIRPGTVDMRRTVTYATRLRALLYTFNGLRKTAFESRPGRAFAGATEAIQTLHSVRWMIIEQDTKLLLTVNFDTPWEPYIRRIVDVAGPILDAILCHCVNYEPYSTDLGYRQFAQWVANHQDDCEFFYSAASDLTVDDLAYLREFKKLHGANEPADFDSLAARLRAPTPGELANRVADKYPADEQEQGLQALEAFYRLEETFRHTASGKHAWFLWKAVQLALSKFEFLDRIEPALAERYADAIRWARTEPRHQGPKPPLPPPEVTDLQPVLNDLQGNVLNGFAPMTHGCIALLRIADLSRAKDWLATLNLTMDGELGTVDAALGKVASTIAFTYHGLRRSGLPKAELGRLPKEFREGMEERAGYLGDLQANHPDQWQLPRIITGYSPQGAPEYGPPLRMSSVDLLLNLQGRFETGSSGDHRWSQQHPLYQHLQDTLSGQCGVEVLAVQALRRPLLQADELVRGHFGLADGISQPKPVLGPSGRDEVKLGELLLGHANDKDDPLQFSPGEFGYNGTFLVLRKLAQDVSRFKDFVDGAAAVTSLQGDLVVGKMLGRWPNGTLMHEPEQPVDDNNFDFASDPDGEACPFHAHIRRANPRGSSEVVEQPRILRRGFMYGPLPGAENADADEQGLMFMALNANIAEQFEIVQRWCAQGNSTRIFSGDADPLLGVAKRDQPRMLRFADGDKVHRLDMNEDGSGEQFVTLRWGLYSFVPSRSGISAILSHMQNYLAAAGNGRDIDALDFGIGKRNTGTPAQYGRRVAALLPDNPVIWKVALEDASARGAGITEGLWSHIQNQGGVQRTPFGILVADPQLVQEVLADRGERFSARMYWQRLRNAHIGDGYIGMDRDPTEQQPAQGADADLDDQYRSAVCPGRYRREGEEFNQRIGAETRPPAYDQAYAATAAFLQSQLRRPHVGDDVDINLETLIDHVLANLSSAWFGIPVDANDVDTIQAFAALAGYVFNPHPTPYLNEQGIAGGSHLRDAGAQYLANLQDGSAPDSISKDLYTATLANPDNDIETPEDFIRTLVGVAQGFTGPTRSTFLSAIALLQQTEELWRAQAGLGGRLAAGAQTLSYEDAVDLVLPTLETAMCQRPIPEIVYRKAVTDTQLGHFDIRAGEIVTVSLRRASARNFNALFGGEYRYGGSDTSHACPGRNLAMGTMLGILTAILMCGTLVPGPSPVVLSIQNRGAAG